MTDRGKRGWDETTRAGGRTERGGVVSDLDGAEDEDREQYGADDDAIADPPRLLLAPQRRLHHAATADLLLVPPPQPLAGGAPTRPRSGTHAPPQAAAFGAPARSTKCWPALSLSLSLYPRRRKGVGREWERGKRGQASKEGRLQRLCGGRGRSDFSDRGAVGFFSMWWRKVTENSKMSLGEQFPDCSLFYCSIRSCTLIWECTVDSGPKVTVTVPRWVLFPQSENPRWWWGSRRGNEETDWSLAVADAEVWSWIRVSDGGVG
jgi:hypothetical protein